MFIHIIPGAYLIRLLLEKYTITADHSNQDQRWTPNSVFSTMFTTEFGPDY